MLMGWSEKMITHNQHPQWEELESLCNQIENLKEKAHNLREQIDNDLKNQGEIKNDKC